MFRWSCCLGISVDLLLDRNIQHCYCLLGILFGRCMEIDSHKFDSCKSNFYRMATHYAPNHARSNQKTRPLHLSFWKSHKKCMIDLLTIPKKQETRTLCVNSLALILGSFDWYDCFRTHLIKTGYWLSITIFALQWATLDVPGKNEMKMTNWFNSNIYWWSLNDSDTYSSSHFL